MTFGTLLELYDNWNDIYEKRKDLLDRTVVSFGFYDDIFTVRLAD